MEGYYRTLAEGKRSLAYTRVRKGKHDERRGYFSCITRYAVSGEEPLAKEISQSRTLKRKRKISLLSHHNWRN